MSRAVFMLALASACATFSGAVSADEATPVVKRNVRLLTQAAPSYPEEAKAAGHQGVVKLRLSINAEGGIEGVEMTESSKSAILDAAAVEHVKAWKLLPAIDSDDKPVAVKVDVPIEYGKDSIAHLPAKACSDLNVDVSWFRSVYPDKPISDMRLYNLSLGLLAMGAGSAPKMLETSRKFSKAFDKTVERCAEKPDEKYWENVVSKMNAWF